MSTDTTATLGQQLASARSRQQQIAAAPFDAVTSLAEAYQIQQHATAAYGSSQIGYKIGATNVAVQKMFNCDSPFYGPLFKSDLLDQGKPVSNHAGILGGEAEFAFRCASDFPTDRELLATDLPGLISDCCIAVEIVGRRLLGDGLPTFHAAVADFGVNAAFITGNSIDNWSHTDLSSVAVTAAVNGEQTNSGTGAAVLGNPLNAILWLHATLRDHGGQLKAGDWISTGTCLGVIAHSPGAQVDVEFAGCGSLSYQVIA